MPVNNLVAAIQMVSTDKLEENLAQTAALLQMARDQGAVLAVLPENFALVADKSDIQRLADETREVDSRIRVFLREQSCLLSLWVIAGSLPWSPDKKSKPFSRCWVYDSQGNEVNYYDKTHLFDAKVSDGQGSYKESDTFSKGSQAVVVDSPVGKIGLSICFDLRFPLLYQRLMHQGAEILVMPSAFTWKTGQAHWEVLLRARAIENQCYVIAANQGGQHSPKRQTWGHSMIIDPWGDVLSQKADGAGVILSEIQRDFMDQIRNNISLNEVPLH